MLIHALCGHVFPTMLAEWHAVHVPPIGGPFVKHILLHIFQNIIRHTASWSIMVIHNHACWHTATSTGLHACFPSLRPTTQSSYNSEATLHRTARGWAGEERVHKEDSTHTHHQAWAKMASRYILHHMHVHVERGNMERLTWSWVREVFKGLNPPHLPTLSQPNC